MPEFHHPYEVNAFVRERAETVRREASLRTRMPNLRHHLVRVAGWLRGLKVDGRAAAGGMARGAQA